MAIYALRDTTTNAIIRIRQFSSAPPVLSPAKGVQWFPYILPVPVPTAEQLAAQAAFDKLATDRTAALGYAKLTTLSEMTRAEISGYFGPPRYPGPAANLAEANALISKLNDDLATLAVGVGLLIRAERLRGGA